MIREIFDPQIKEEGKAEGLREGILLILSNRNMIDFEIENNLNNIHDINLLKRIMVIALSNKRREVLLSQINALVKNKILNNTMLVEIRRAKITNRDIYD